MNILEKAKNWLTNKNNRRVLRNGALIASGGLLCFILGENHQAKHTKLEVTLIPKEIEEIPIEKISKK